MIIQLTIGKIVRLDLLPHSLVIVLSQRYLMGTYAPSVRTEERGVHAECGVWWCDSNLGAGLVEVLPVLVSESTANALGIHNEAVYPIRPPGGRAGESENRNHGYLCYGWRDSGIPHSVPETFGLTEHGPSDGKDAFWELSWNGVRFVLPSFDPSVDPLEGLAVHEVLSG